MIRTLIILVIAFASFTADARMYQWVDPDNGTTQLSGKPPVWYRSRKGGPRVFVFENGKIIDDTANSVSEMERQNLRKQAFLKAEGDKVKVREKLLEAKRLQAALNPQNSEEEESLKKQGIDTDNKSAINKPTPSTELETVDQMKKLIQEWEAQRTRSAKQLIQPGTDK